MTVNLALTLDLLDLVNLAPLVCWSHQTVSLTSWSHWKAQKGLTGDGGKVLVVVSGSLGVADVEEGVLARVLVLVVRRESRLLEVSLLASQAVVRTLGAVGAVSGVSAVSSVGAVGLVVGGVSAGGRGRAGGVGGGEASVGARGGLVDRVGSRSRSSARSRGLDDVTGGAVASRRAGRRSGRRTGSRVRGRRRVAVAGRGGVGGLVRVREHLLDLRKRGQRNATVRRSANYAPERSAETAVRTLSIVVVVRLGV